MTRDKLLTIRIEEDKRQAFNSWCEAREYSYSKFLYEVIEACLDGRIDDSILAGKPVDNNLANELNEQIKQLDKSIDERIEQRLSNSIDNSVGMDSKIKEIIANELANFKNELAPILDAQEELESLLEKQEA